MPKTEKSNTILFSSIPARAIHAMTKAWLTIDIQVHKKQFTTCLRTQQYAHHHIIHVSHYKRGLESSHTRDYRQLNPKHNAAHLDSIHSIGKPLVKIVCMANNWGLMISICCVVNYDARVHVMECVRESTLLPLQQRHNREYRTQTRANVV